MSASDSQNDVPNALEEVRDARDCLDAGDFTEALLHAARALSVDPELPEAIACADEAIARAPNVLALLEPVPGIPFGIVALRARALAACGHRIDAIDLAIQVAAFRPSLPYVEWCVGWMPPALTDAEVDRLCARIGALVQALTLPLDDGQARNASAAEALLARLPPIQRDSPKPRFLRVALLRRLERGEEALALSQEMWRTDRTWLAATTLGNVLRDLGRLEESAAAFREATQLDARDASAWSDLAFVLLSLGRLEEARDACRAALERDPADSTALRLLESLPRTTSPL